ncbi:hypothetical protein C1Y40_05801 [Mycobacterium talmoniae]|uniref:Uncharacterized protein n=1 Tax=Mycobacterium talmoniae TaxID=1858794 RepID=A0A2S8BBK5_9MYCO|nr:hypothetical protein C1Y40_05801 [Mycobacterium talmoniae]
MSAGCSGSTATAAGNSASASVSSTCWLCRCSIVMNIRSPRSVRSTSMDDTIAIITPKKLWRRTPVRTSSMLSGQSGPSAV